MNVLRKNVSIVLLGGILSHASGDGFTLLLRHSEGGRQTDVRYTVTVDEARLEAVEPTRPPSPVNLIDRATGTLTILRPHNRSVSTLAADAWDARRNDTASPCLPDGVGPNPAMPAAAPATGRIGPDPSMLPPGTEPPERPGQTGMLSLPRDMPGMPVMSGAGMMPGIPGGPFADALPTMAMLAMGDRVDERGKLAAHDETRVMLGYPCRRHTLVMDASLEMDLWLADSPDFPPFHLLTWDGPPPFGPRNPLREWPHIVRRQEQFPLLAVLRAVEPRMSPVPGKAWEEGAGEAREAPASQEIARWEVVALSLVQPDPALFEIPEGYSSLDAGREGRGRLPPDSRGPTPDDMAD